MHEELQIGYGVVVWLLPLLHKNMHKSKDMFCESSNPVHGVLDICDGKSFWWCS